MESRMGEQYDLLRGGAKGLVHSPVSRSRASFLSHLNIGSGKCAHCAIATSLGGKGKAMRPVSWLLLVMAATGMLIISAPAFAEPATAPLNFCNRTSNPVAVAVGYYSSGVNDTQNELTGPFVSRGWWTVNGGQCQSLANPFDARYMFWFALPPENPSSVPPDTNADGSQIDAANPARHMCIRSMAFTFEDDNVSYGVCKKNNPTNSRWVLAHKVDTEVDPDVNFTGYDY
jgi:uncharacterized membrane protein